MGIWTDRLTFAQGYSSYASMARTYEIPYQTLLKAKNTGEIPSAFSSQFNRLWKTETYSIMRKENVPAYNANNLRGGAVSSVKSAIEGWNALYDYWAVGGQAVRSGTFDKAKWSKIDWDSFYVIRSKIIESSNRSKLTYEVAEERNTSM